MDDTASVPEDSGARARRGRLIMIAAPVAALVIAAAAGAYFGLRGDEQHLGLRETVEQFITASTTEFEGTYLEYSAPECREMWSSFGGDQQDQPPAAAPAPEEIPAIVALKENSTTATVILRAPAGDRNIPMYWVRIEDRWLISCPTEEKIPTLEPVPPDQRISLRDTAQQALDRLATLSSTDIGSVEAFAEYYIPACRQLVESSLYSMTEAPAGRPSTITSVVENGDTGTVDSTDGSGTDSQEWEKHEGRWLMDCADMIPHQS